MRGVYLLKMLKKGTPGIFREVLMRLNTLFALFLSNKKGNLT